MLYQRKIVIISAWIACSLLLSSCSTPYLTVSAENDFKHGYYARAFEKLWMPAHSGNPRAQYALGYLYYYGLGTVRDQDLARVWFRHAAECHYPPAVVAYKRLTNPEYTQYVAVQTRASNSTVKTYKFYGDGGDNDLAPQSVSNQKPVSHALKESAPKSHNHKLSEKLRSSVKSQTIRRGKH